MKTSSKDELPDIVPSSGSTVSRQEGRWVTILLPASIVLLGLAFGLIPLLQGELFLFNDNGNEYYPHTEFLVRALKSRVIPQWWFQVGTGIPVIAEGEAHYTPIRLLLAGVLDAPASFMAEIALYFALAGLGTYFFLREIRLHALASSAGAIGFMFGSQFVVYVRDMGLLRAACFFPWVMWLAESSFREQRTGKVLWIAPPIIALQFLSGNPVFAVVTLVASCFYLIARSAFLRRTGDLSPRAMLGQALRILSIWSLITLLGVGMAAIHVVPMLRHVKESVRAGGLTLEYAANSNHSKITDIPHAFFPYVYDLHNPVVAVAGYYDGALLAVAVCFTLWWIRRLGAPAWCLALSVVAATLIALGSYTPIYGLLWHLPLLNGFRFPLRYQFWASFCFACLGAIGLDRALAWKKASSALARSGPVLTISAFVLIVSAAFWRLRPMRHRELIWCVLLLFASTAVLLTLTAVRRPLALLAAINVLLLADLAYFRFFAGYAPTTKIAVGLKSDGMADWLRQDPGRFRILSVLEPEYVGYLVNRPDLQQGEFRLQNILIGSAPALWGLESVTYHGSLELRRFEKVIEALSLTLRRQPEQASQISSFLDFLQTKYVLARRGFIFKGWEKVREEGGMTAWRIPDFHGGEFLVGRVVQENTVKDESIIEEIRSRSIDFRHTATVAAEKIPELNGLGRGEVRRMPAGYDAMGFHVISDRPALLVIPVNYYPGWKATINGRRARIYRTNWIGMGIFVQPGESLISMEFSTPGLHTGISLTILSLAVWLVISMAIRKWRISW